MILRRDSEVLARSIPGDGTGFDHTTQISQNKYVKLGSQCSTEPSTRGPFLLDSLPLRR